MNKSDYWPTVNKLVQMSLNGEIPELGSVWRYVAGNEYIVTGWTMGEHWEIFISYVPVDQLDKIPCSLRLSVFKERFTKIKGIVP